MENNPTMNNIHDTFDLNYLNLSRNISYPENATELRHCIVMKNNYNNEIMNLLSAILPLYLRAGFILIQIGCTPTSNSNLIILQNIIDFAVATISYCLFGCIFTFGDDFKGLIGLFNSNCIDNIDMNLFMYGWSTIMITTGIITTMFAGRMHTIGYICLSFLTAGFLQPIFMHWIWDKRGLLRYNVFQTYEIMLIDNAGVSSIHVCAGIIAFVGNLCFGRKLIKLKDLDREYLASTPLTVIGYFLVISGLIANIPPLEISQSENINYLIHFARNNILALSGGIIGTAFLMKYTKCICEADEWLITRYMQGGIMGMVTISGGIYMYSSITSFIIGYLSSILLVGLSKSLLKSAFDDYCHVIPIHLVGGFVGLILPPFFMCKSFLSAQILFIQLGWQSIGFFSIVLTSILIILPLFLLLKSFRLLRNEFEEKGHQLAMDTVKQIPPQDFFKRLYKIPQRKFLEEDGVVGKNNDSCFCTKFVLRNAPK